SGPRCCSWRSSLASRCTERARRRGAAVVRELGGIPIDYKAADFVNEVHRLTGDGVDAVFDGIGGDNLWRSPARGRPSGDLRLPIENAGRTYGFPKQGASPLSRIR